MKNVTLSAVVRDHARRQLLCPIRSMRQLRAYAITLALGLPVIAFLTQLLDPTAPLGYIVVPVLAGGLLPAFALLPGRFEIGTRFHACHLAGTLDETLCQLGYTKAEGDGAGARYRTRRWPGGRDADIAVTFHPHAADITGPLGTLRALQRQLAC